MKYYGFYTHELTALMQTFIDYVLQTFPTDSPPKGFKWMPIVKLNQNDESVNIEWVLKNETN